MVTGGNDQLIDSTFDGRIYFGTNNLNDLKATQTGDHLVIKGTGTNELTFSDFYAGSQISGWSFAYNGGSTSFALSDIVNLPPVVTVFNSTVDGDESVAASSLFTASDPDGDPLTRYAFKDLSPSGGYFTLNGVAVVPDSFVVVDAVDLGSVRFVGGSSAATDTVIITVDDGFGWATTPSGYPTGTITTTVVPNTPPTVTVINTSIGNGQAVAAASLFTASDPDGDAFTRYAFKDLSAGGGFFTLNGSQIAADSFLVVDAAQLSQVQFVGGSSGGTDNIIITADDGEVWAKTSAGDYPTGTITTTGTPNTPPSVSVIDRSVDDGEAVAASSLFTATDADGDVLTRYAFKDVSAGGGHFALNGAEIPTDSFLVVDAADLSSVQYVGGPSAGTDTVIITADDGSVWAKTSSGAYPSGTITTTVTPNQTPVVTLPDSSLESGTSVAAASLFSATDPDGDPFARYAFKDVSPGGGYFTLNGAEIPTDSFLVVDAADLGAVRYVGGPAAGTDTVIITADDGEVWGADSSGNLPTGTITTTAPTPNQAPVVTVSSASIESGNSALASSLFTATDPDGDAFTRYAFKDLSDGGGFFTLNGAEVVTGSFFVVDATGLGTVEFVAGPSAGTDDIVITADDGEAWGTDGSGNTPTGTITTTFTPNQAPIVTVFNSAVETGETVAASSLFSASDPDGDPFTRYAFKDLSPGGGHFTLNGVEVPTDSFFVVDAANLGAVQFVGGGLASSDDVVITADDGEIWGTDAGGGTPTGTITTAPNQPPLVTVYASTVDSGVAVAASTLFTATDAEGDPFTRYALKDLTIGGGYFTRDGVEVETGSFFVVDAADLDTVQFVGGPSFGTDSVIITADDGTNWGTDGSGNYPTGTITTTVEAFLSADELVFIFDPAVGSLEDPTSSLLGLPDGAERDLDGGGATFRFSSSAEVFDYTVALPEGTDLVITNFIPGDQEPIVTFGYGTPVDADSDGVADVPDGTATLINRFAFSPVPWNKPAEQDFGTELFFYSLRTDAAFVGLGDDFFLSIDDVGGDFDLDAVQLVTTIPSTAVDTFSESDGGVSAGSFAVDDIAVSEDEGVAQFTVTRTGGNLAAPATFEFNVSDDTTGVGDIVTIPNQIVTMAPGQQTYSINVQLIDDGFAESEEIFVANIYGFDDSGGKYNADKGEARIYDDDWDGDGSPLAEFHVSGVGVDEDVGNVTITLQRKNGDLGAATTIDYTTQDGIGSDGAVAGLDYVATSGTLTFQSGQSFASVTVETTNDTLPEPDEDFEVVFTNVGNPLGGGIVDGDATIVIYDDGDQVGTAGYPLHTLPLGGGVNWLLSGADDGDRAGRSVSGAGDFNGDGFDDFLVGAPYAEAGFTWGSGAAYLLLGGPDLGGSLTLGGFSGADGVSFLAAADKDQIGHAVSAAGDINGDGFADIVIGGPRSDPGGNASAGTAYVVFGGTDATGPGTRNVSDLSGSNGFSIEGVGTFDYTGMAVSGGGDFNGDGFDDLLIGADAAPNLGDYGATYVVFGGSTVGATGSIALSNLDGSNGFTVNGIAAGDRFGSSVDRAGDINGDGFEDFIIGAVGFELDTHTNEGQAYVLFGGSSLGAGGTIDLANLDGSNGFSFGANGGGGQFGYRVSTGGDVNGDGFADLLCGHEPFISTELWATSRTSGWPRPGRMPRTLSTSSSRPTVPSTTRRSNAWPETAIDC